MESDHSSIVEFINCYRLHPCLWDMKLKEYSHRRTRNQAYDELVKICKKWNKAATRDTVTKKIQNLRCSYRRELKKMKSSFETSGTSADTVYQPTLWYFHLLDEFLRDSRPWMSDEDELKERSGNNTTENAPNTVEGEDDDDENNFSDASETKFKSHTSTPSNSSSRPTTLTTGRRKRKSPQIELMEIASETLKNWSSNNNNESLPRKEPDEFDIAGQKLAFDLRSMSDDQRIFAEKLINDIVFYGKRGNLNDLSFVNIQMGPPRPYFSDAVGTQTHQ